VHYAIPHSVSALLARQMLAARGRRLPFVTTLHGTDITLVGLDRSYLPITRYAIQESDGVTSISNYLKEKTVEDFGVTRGIEVVPNFVNCDVYTPIRRRGAREARKRLADPDEAILMHLSNFRPVKRVVDVVKIFAQVVREIPARLVLVGDGPDRSAAEWLAHDLGIHDKFTSWASRSASTSCSRWPTSADAQRTGVLRPGRARSHGLQGPSIATRVGGVPELIDDGVTGLLYPVGDVDAMAEGALSLLKTIPRLALKPCATPAAKLRKSASAPRWSCRTTCAITTLRHLFAHFGIRHPLHQQPALRPHLHPGLLQRQVFSWRARRKNRGMRLGLYPFAIYFSAGRVWEYSLTGLLFTTCFCIAQRIHRAATPLAWLGWGALCRRHRAFQPLSAFHAAVPAGAGALAVRRVPGPLDIVRFAHLHSPQSPSSPRGQSATTAPSASFAPSATTSGARRSPDAFPRRHPPACPTPVEEIAEAIDRIGPLHGLPFRRPPLAGPSRPGAGRRRRRRSLEEGAPPST
jgi:hypothetical protein